MNRTIIIMAKVPRAGNVKTRLESFLSQKQCVSLSEAFLEDAVNKVQAQQSRLIIAFSPPPERDYFAKYEVVDFTLIEQTGSDLGEKMFNAFQFAFSNDSDAIVMIGTDSPTFPVEFIERAFVYLDKTDVVLGEAEDGGFYLIGLRTLNKKIFENVVWSSANTFEQTRKNIEKIGLSLSLLPTWFDVDVPADLAKLQNSLIKHSDQSPHTFQWVRKNL